MSFKHTWFSWHGLFIPKKLQDKRWGWTFQIYYPKIHVSNLEVYTEFKTGFRWVYYPENGGWVFGFSILGFGCGFGWHGYKCPDCNGLGVHIHESGNSNKNTICKSCSGLGAIKLNKGENNED